MKALISILIVVGVVFTAWKLFEYWDRVGQQREAQVRKSERQQIDPRQLEGVPRELEPSLDQAYNGGARTLKKWLEQYKGAPKVKDPRLAWIQLDYVVMAQDDPVGARKVFAEVKQRTPTDSPVYPRIKQLEKTYE